MVQTIENPSISVALPIRNGMPQLLNAMKGLISQTYTNFELVVQDSLSTDGTVEYLQSLQTKFPIHIVSEKDDSLTDGYNRCLARCSNDLIVMTACDEYFDADAFEKYVSWYRANPDAVFIYGGSRLVDSEGKTLSEERPGDFDLLQYIRAEMCHTQAGIYNRAVLGDDLRFDPQLPLCPDYDMAIRIALVHGDDKFRFVNDITMSARADASSMSYQPDLYAKFAGYKMKAVDRLLGGPYAERFQAHLRRDFEFRLYYTSAKLAHSINGDTEAFRDLALQASRAMPGRPQLRELAELSSGLTWAGPSIGLEPRVVYGSACPPEARVVFHAGPAEIQCPPYWQRAGAGVEPAGSGAKVTLPDAAWHYAAMIPLDLSTVDRSVVHGWVQVSLRDVEGDILCGFYDAQMNDIALESALPQTPDPQIFEVELTQKVGSTLLLRSGPAGGAASVVVDGVEVKVLDKVKSQ